MASELFLIAPIDADATTFGETLSAAVADIAVAALFLPKGERTEEAYQNFATALIPLAQDLGCAVLLDNDYALAKKLGADGVHMSTGITKFKDAIEALKPDMIVGAGAIHSRHDAMSKAEAGADYIFFDSDTQDEEPSIEVEESDVLTFATSIFDQAEWWTETFEIPCVMIMQSSENFASCPSEFMALGDVLWSSATPHEILSTANATLVAPQE